MVLDIQDHGVASEKPRARREMESRRVVGAEFQENPKKSHILSQKEEEAQVVFKTIFKIRSSC